MERTICLFIHGAVHVVIFTLAVSRCPEDLALVDGIGIYYRRDGIVKIKRRLARPFEKMGREPRTR